VRLGRVLDHDEAVPRRDLEDGIHVGGLPYRCTGRIAFVRGVIAASTRAGSIVQ
jgi:hypothetical protein